MNRRHFLKILLAGVAAATAGGSKFLKLVAPRRFLRARPLDKYPGGVRRLSDDQMRRPADWGG